jgi:hypothetical protein
MTVLGHQRTSTRATVRSAFGGTLYGDALSKPGGDADTYLKMLRHDVACAVLTDVDALLGDDRVAAIDRRTRISAATLLQ